MAELQFPNIVGQYQQGYDRGRGQLADRLAGQAYGAQGADRQSALSQLAGVNPQAAMSMGDRFQQQDQAQQAQAKAQDVDHAQKLNGAARFMLQAVATKDPARIQGSWQAVRPYLAELSGKEPPAQFDPAMLPKMYEILGQTGGAPEQKGTVVAPGGALVDSATGQQMFANPAAQQYHDVPMGDGKAAGVFDPATGSIRPATVGGSQPSAPAGDPMQPFIEQANHAVQLGADPDKVQAWLVQQAQGAGLNPQAPGAAQPQAQGQAPAQFGIGTPKAAANTPSGYRMKPDGSGALEPIPGGPADKSGAGNVSLGDPNQTGPAYLASINDPSMRAQIQAIAEGRMPLPKVSRPGKNGEISPQTIQQAVAQYDPTYDQADPTSRIKARNAFTGDGQSSKQLRQLNTLLGHLGGLADAADKLDNTGSTIINSAENAVGSTYNAKVSNFNAAARPAAEEFAALLKGGVPSVEEIKQAHDMLDANRTPEQLHGVIGTMAAQIQSRIAALKRVADTSLGPFASKVQIITPEGQAALDKLRERGMIGKFDLGEPGTAPQQAAQQPASNGWAIQRVN